ncbi:major tail protein [Rossellomorea marisflavi]|uniref:major tail protein n=1 Tax=Rossellomorea marisflavi TaxID=189381 RepID=UPI0039BFFAA8
MPEKIYKASTGVEEFYYAVLAEDGSQSIIKENEEISAIKFLQNIEIEMPQEMVRAFGDNKTAELGVSNGNTTITSGFHTLPIEDRIVLFGAEKSEDGLAAYGSDDHPPFVACVFAKTHEGGDKEWVGLTKGKFMRSNISGQTKEESTEFSQSEMTGEFMERKVQGYEKEKTCVFGWDKKGETAKRDALFQKVFGKAYPGAPVVPEGA